MTPGCLMLQRDRWRPSQMLDIQHKEYQCMMDSERGVSGISDIAIAADVQDKHHECKCVLCPRPD